MSDSLITKDRNTIANLIKLGHSTVDTCCLINRECLSAPDAFGGARIIIILASVGQTKDNLDKLPITWTVSLHCGWLLTQ